jgi:hypothetical protein
VAGAAGDTRAVETPDRPEANVVSFSRPYETEISRELTYLPGVEMPGYYQAPIRDAKNIQGPTFGPSEGPGGTIDSSPPLQWRVLPDEMRAPQARLKPARCNVVIFQLSLRDGATPVTDPIPCTLHRPWDSDDTVQFL